jgi:hypothetical protein
MNGLDPLAEALRSERDALAGSAPAPDFPAVWREVEARREKALQRFLVLAAAVPTVLLFLGGVASLLLGGGVLAGAPLLAVAFWLVVEGVDLSPLPAGERDSREAAG